MSLAEVLFDHLHATAFQQTGLGRTILGSAENVRTITRENLSAYIGTHYTAPRMVLVGSGAVDHDELVKLATNAFGGLSTAGASCDCTYYSPPRALLAIVLTAHHHVRTSRLNARRSNT